MRVLAISGSLRAGSYNSALLRAAGELLPPGGELEVWEGLRDVPAYDADLEADFTPAAVLSLREAVAAADAVLIATPEYNSSIPGALKNALDWASRPLNESPFRGKPVSVIGSSTGMFGAVWAQAELRKVLAAMGSRVTGKETPIGQVADKIDADGRVTDNTARAAIRENLLALAAEVELNRAAA